VYGVWEGLMFEGWNEVERSI